VQTSANVKETLESILVAFILAFIFRCFVVEAFVIPTGSMAPTLLGAHSRFECPDCGYRFDVNYSQPEQPRSRHAEASNGHPAPDDIDIPDRVQPVEGPGGRMVEVEYDDVHCPNCGLRLPAETSPRVIYGDRILVLKYIYLLHGPQRWDVVVFKSPTEPQRYDYSQNFIKRLIGRPRETIMVLDGDIYVKEPGSDHFEVARKTRAAQEALWRILYDNDYHPEGSATGRKKAWRQPWQQTDGTAVWDTAASSGGRQFAFTAAPSAAGQAAFGTLTFNAETNLPDNEAFGYSDWLAYDQRLTTRGYRGGWPGKYPVSDLKLDLYYTRSAGEGPLRLRLTKLDHAFTAEIRPGEVKLIHERKGMDHAIEHSAKIAGGSHPLHVEFINADYRVTLRIDGRDVLTTTDAEYSPDIEDLKRRQLLWETYPGGFGANGLNSGSGREDPPLAPPTASITAERQSCRIDHLGLWRDVYYTQTMIDGSPVRWAGFRSVAGGSGGPITLGADEYFVMGDNSPVSNDARFWMEPINLKDEQLHAEPGRIPGRFLLGQAFFVYWPAGFRPMERAPGVIPDFGQMRFIR
jgi:signal peptidase I